MKNKKLLFILIPGTLLVWGIIIYKLFSTVAGDKSNNSTPIQVQKSSSKEKVLAETFTISANYRDPFLGILKYPTKSKPTIKIQPKVKAIVKAENPFPRIVYSGLIKNKQSNKQLVLIQINGVSTYMNIGEIKNEIELLQVSRDSIEVEFQNERRFIKK